MNKLNKALTLIALLSSSTVFAGTDKETDFDALDVDGDGVLTQSEASVNTDLLSKFAELDTNNDGELSRTEFSKYD